MTARVETVKEAARGRWIEILTAAGLPSECLTGRNGPCPKCGGEDRFAAFKDVAETGGVNCRQCHYERNGDGIATVQWWRDCSFQEAVEFVAEWLGPERAPSKPNGERRIVPQYDDRTSGGVFPTEGSTMINENIHKLLANLKNVKPCGDNEWTAYCPEHEAGPEPHHISLSIKATDGGHIVVHCHAGCDWMQVIYAAGLRPSDCSPPQQEQPMSKMTATYDYEELVDGERILRFEVCRWEPGKSGRPGSKDFRQRQPDGKGGYSWNMNGVTKILYRLPELLLAKPSDPVFIVEGEKQVDYLRSRGLIATTNPGGAGKWLKSFAKYFADRDVVVIPDCDPPNEKTGKIVGAAHAKDVADSLLGTAKSIHVIELRGCEPKWGLDDWLQNGHTLQELQQILATAEPWGPESQLGTQVLSAPEALPWPEIDSLDELNLPDFPTHVLPDALRRWVEAESHATQTPTDLAALLALSVCSSCIARRVEVEPRPGWREPVNLFTAVLLEPGNRKSAVFADALKPLRELEVELIEAARPEVARAQSKRRKDETRLKKLERTAAEKQGDVAAQAQHEAGNLAADLANNAPPALPRLIVDDATSEKLGMMLEEQDGRIASMSPEGGVFDLMAGMYSKSGMPQFGVYLMGHAGDDLITDRVTRKGVRVERPALTCAYAIQPAVIVGLAENAAFRVRGLLGRFLYAAPASWIGERKVNPAPVSPEVRESYWRTVRTLAGSFENSESDSAPILLQLEPDAHQQFIKWETEIEDMLNDGGEMEVMRDWGAKLAGATLRLAAVLHCVSCGPAGRIQKCTIEAAVEIARYLFPHADAVLNMMLATEESPVDGARYVLRWIERHRRQEFTKRDAQQHGKRRFPKAEDIDPALSELTRRGYIREKTNETTGRGRPPSPAYEVNPAVFAAKTPQNRSQNSHNSTGESEKGISENIGSASEPAGDTNRVRVTI